MDVECSPQMRPVGSGTESNAVTSDLTETATNLVNSALSHALALLHRDTDVTAHRSAVMTSQTKRDVTEAGFAAATLGAGVEDRLVAEDVEAFDGGQ